jgi:hypothetical protein
MRQPQIPARPGPSAVRGGPNAVRPYNPQDSVKVIRHDSECIQLKLLSHTARFEPLFPHNLAALIFLHLVINDPPKYALFPERA